MLQKYLQDGHGGDTEKGLERYLLNDKHPGPLPLLDFTLGEALVTHSFPIKPAFQGFGSVPGGSGECNDEVNISFFFRDKESEENIVLIKKDESRALDSRYFGREESGYYYEAVAYKKGQKHMGPF